MKLLTSAAILIAILGGGIWIYLYSCTTDSCLYFEWQKTRVVDSFERCEALGFPVMESYPRQCKAGERSFTEDIENVPNGTEGELFENENVTVSSPGVNALVTSPLTITGEARGPWYFEATFPVMILDANGEKLGAHYAQAEGEWMTTEFVPFTAELEFETPKTATGTLVLLKDNPSGLPEHDDSVSIPVRFK